MHLDEEQALRLLHGELPDHARAAAAAHLAACETCAALLERERREEEATLALLQRLDHPAPAPRAADVLRRRPRARRPSVRRAAALLIVAAGAGAAYAMPASPLRALVERLRGERLVSPAPAPAPPERSPSASGVAVAPGASLVIEVAAPRGAAVRLRLVDDSLVAVRVAEGRAAFASDVQRLLVSAEGSAVVVVDVPRSAARVDVAAGGRTVLRARAGRVSGGEAAPDGARVARVAPAPP